MEDRQQKRLKMDSSDANELNVGLGFNHIDFSDRVLRLEITPALPSNKSKVSKASEFVATDLKVKKIHINSLLLAYKSQFFFKLIKNGKKEAKERGEVALRIGESEEAAFLDLLKFIYDHSVNATSASDLVGVLMAAIKFEVPSCIRYCVELLLKLPLSITLALLFLALSLVVLAKEMFHPLTESAKSFICAHFMDFTKSQEEAMSLPLYAVELVIGSDGLKVDSEDDVFDFILKWGRLRYPELEERREILTRLVLNFISLLKMSSFKLKEMLDCSDFNFEKLWKPVVDALFSKNQDLPTKKCEYPRRIYNHRDVKVVQLQLARPQCVVYFDLKKEEFADLTPQERLYSRTFCLCGRKIRLFAQCNKEHGPIGLHVYLVQGSESCTLAFNISVVKKSSKEFTRLVKSSNIIFQPTESHGFVYNDLFKLPWADFMSNDSQYFIDGILHLRFDITLIN